MAADESLDDESFAERLAELDADLAAGRMPARELPGRLRRGVAALQALRRMGWDPNLTLPNGLTRTPHRAAHRSLPAHVGRFRVQRELGRGGFGVVYLAEDPRLGREVALKVPHAAAIVDEQLRERFRREGRAAAGLDHPNIVPVHEVDESGPLPVLVCAYCPGITLAEWLSRQKSPVPADDAARLIATLAEAVDYAHRQGVLHRDLKPANVLLQRADTPPSALDPNGRDELHRIGLPEVLPRVTDFGLAKLPEDGGEMTMHGAILGTPAYMAPEQARGQTARADARADVYALGVMLYELLVGHPPFRGESDLDTLYLVTRVEAVSPRQMRPKLPRDLETVCLKCLHKEPSRRYATAAEVRDDLVRFLEGRPVVARPVGWAERLTLWCRRHPTIAILAAALLLAVVSGVAGIAREYRRANAERTTAVAALQRSDRLLAQSRAALQCMIDFGHSLAHDPATAKHTVEILSKARSHYAAVLAEAPDNVELRRQAATICRRLALVLQSYGTAEQMDEAFAEAKQLTEELHVGYPEDLTLSEALFDIYYHWGRTLIERREFDRGEPLLDQAIAMMEGSLAKPVTGENVYSLALALYHRGERRRRAGQFNGAETDYRRAINLHAKHEVDEDSSENRRWLTCYYVRLATVLVRLNRFDEAEPQLDVIRDRLERFEDHFGLEDRIEIRGNLNGLLGHVRFGQRRWAEADRLLAEANAPIAALVPTAPVRLMYHTFYVKNSLFRSQALDRLGRCDEATAVLRDAAGIDMPPPSKQFVHPSPDYLECLALLLQRLPRDSDQRRAVAEKATTVLEKVADWPTHADARSKLRASLAPP